MNQQMSAVETLHTFSKPQQQQRSTMNHNTSTSMMRIADPDATELYTKTSDLEHQILTLQCQNLDLQYSIDRKDIQVKKYQQQYRESTVLCNTLVQKLKDMAEGSSVTSQEDGTETHISRHDDMHKFLTQVFGDAK
jgi:hypothetical protein